MAALDSYKEIYNSPYFVEKTLILNEIIPRIGTPEMYICITRPRRFGKSVMANMIASFFSKGCNAKKTFDILKIAKGEQIKGAKKTERNRYTDNLNQHHRNFTNL
ncbi:MAG: AAA family ATPase [Lachnospiraceae bacterium]|nr:AAA family ATPase [Lachnospiraceae bacterium]